MFVFENDIKFRATPYKMYDEIEKPNKIERRKPMRKKLLARRKKNPVPLYKVNKLGRYSYLSNVK